MKQTTIAKEVTISGIGLHTGEHSEIKLLPADADDGIYFVRTDVEPHVELPAIADFVVETNRGTVLEKDGVRVHTVEHLLGALYGLGIDNIRIEINGAEPPALDGSAQGFVEPIRQAGIVELDADAEPISVDEPFSMSFEDGKELIILPGKGLKVSFGIEYPHRVVNSQFISLKIDPDTFSKEIAPARTYVFESDLEGIMADGLAKGGSYDNAIVIGEKGIINGELRFPNEPVRHKVLDLMGDMALVGRRLEGHIIAIKTGHPHHTAFAAELRKRFGGDTMDIHTILNIMPHRYPFLLVDRILSLRKDFVVGVKNVTMNEPYFQGHFPGDPIMPGVLIVEAMAQVGGFMLLKHVENVGGGEKLLYFSGIDDVRFKRPVRPGDRLRIEVKLLRFGGRIARMQGVAMVGSELAAKATMSAAIVDKPGGET